MSEPSEFAQILYISTVYPGAAIDMSAILAQARRNNSRDGITGLLMFNGKRFLQVLEGPVEAVEQTFERIRHDSRHRAHVVLSRRAIAAREFRHWSMAFGDGSCNHGGKLHKEIDALTLAANANLRAELLAFAGTV